MVKSKVKSQKSKTDLVDGNLPQLDTNSSAELVDAAYIGPAEVKKIAGLARIKITESEVEKFQRELEEVIEYNMKLLSEVDVTGVEPTSQTTGLINMWQEDKPRLSLSQQTALSNAPAEQGGYFVVKKVLGEA